MVKTKSIDMQKVFFKLMICAFIFSAIFAFAFHSVHASTITLRNQKKITVKAGDEIKLAKNMSLKKIPKILKKVNAKKVVAMYPGTAKLKVKKNGKTVSVSVTVSNLKVLNVKKVAKPKTTFTKEKIKKNSKYVILGFVRKATCTEPAIVQYRKYNGKKKYTAYVGTPMEHRWLLKGEKFVCTVCGVEKKIPASSCKHEWTTPSAQIGTAISFENVKGLSFVTESGTECDYTCSKCGETFKNNIQTTFLSVD